MGTFFKVDLVSLMAFFHGFYLEFKSCCGFFFAWVGYPEPLATISLVEVKITMTDFVH